GLWSVRARIVYGLFYDRTRGSAWTDPMSALAVVASTWLATFGVLRLARFVQMDHAKESFLGFPTPANALFVISLVELFGASPDKAPAVFEANVVVLLATIAASALMISNAPSPKVSDALRVPAIVAATGLAPRSIL